MQKDKSMKTIAVHNIKHLKQHGHIEVWVKITKDECFMKDEDDFPNNNPENWKCIGNSIVGGIAFESKKTGNQNIIIPKYKLNEKVKVKGSGWFFGTKVKVVGIDSKQFHNATLKDVHNVMGNARLSEYSLLRDSIKGLKSKYDHCYIYKLKIV